MKKMHDESRQVLNLYEVHEIEQQEQVKKNRILPTILIIIGILLIIGGLFYKKIINFIGNKDNENKKEETVVVDNDKLKCNYKKDAETLGVSYTYTNSYNFKDKLLKSSETVIKISPLPNSDIGADNIKVLSGKYLDIITALNAVDGIDAINTLKNDILTIKYSVDYSVADLSKIPNNNEIVINNKLDEAYSSIKKKNQLGNYLCQ